MCACALGGRVNTRCKNNAWWGKRDIVVAPFAAFGCVFSLLHTHVAMSITNRKPRGCGAHTLPERMEDLKCTMYFDALMRCYSTYCFTLTSCTNILLQQRLPDTCVESTGALIHLLFFRSFWQCAELDPSLRVQKKFIIIKFVFKQNLQA